MESSLSKLTSRAQKPQVSISSHEVIDLRRLLARLEAKVLGPQPSAQLQHSPLERRRTTANVEYARTLLLRQERALTSIAVPSRKAAQQAVLQQQRALIKRLNDQLFALGQQDEDDLSESDSDPDEPVHDLSTDATSPHTPQAITDPLHSSAPNASPTFTSSAPVPVPSEEPRCTIRARNRSHPDTTPSTTTGTDPSRTALFANVKIRRGNNGTATEPEPKDGPSSESAKRLEAEEATQADLTTSLLALAGALKTSAQALGADLAADDATTLARTQEALAANRTGMDAATQKLGLLRRMSEGRWWWGRMLLYMAIAGLWVVALLLVFVAPKLRF